MEGGAAAAAAEAGEVTDTFAPELTGGEALGRMVLKAELTLLLLSLLEWVGDDRTRYGENRLLLLPPAAVVAAALDDCLSRSMAAACW